MLGHAEHRSRKRFLHHRFDLERMVKVSFEFQQEKFRTGPNRGAKQSRRNIIEKESYFDANIVILEVKQKNW